VPRLRLLPSPRPRREPPQLSDRPRRLRWLNAAAVVVLLTLLGAVGWFWYQSLVPSTYSVMDMGYVDYGGGPGGQAGMAGMPVMSGEGDHAGHDMSGVSVADLTGPTTGTPVMSATLVARRGTVHLASGETVQGYTLNGSTPGPELAARAGDLVQITLRNKDVPGGVSLHWHGIDVPNAEDGVAGVTQDAVPVGGSHVYRFVVPDAGTYWYHSHQVSHEQVRGGLFGAFVVAPPAEPADSTTATGDTGTDLVAPAADVLAVVHTYDGHRTVNGSTGVTHAEVTPGSTARVRVVNTDSGAARVWVSGSSYRVLAVDGYDLEGGTQLRHRTLLVPAGGRADLEVTVPGGRAARVDVGGGAALSLGPARGAVAEPEPTDEVDLLSYGHSTTELPFDPRSADRRFDYQIGRRIGFLDGRPGFWWTINGHQFPDVPMYVVDKGDVVVMTIKNSSGDAHPMHLHGHHAVVLSRNGVESTGAQWWIDSLQVEDGDSYQVAFLADNPGIWMDHCHNLPHAAQGLVTHLAYNGVREPFIVGRQVGDAHNQPE
jgi:FtsP/CotA-like multicopper oxidase with cupredoxin domain